MTISEIENYLSKLTDSQKAELERILTLTKQTVPEARETFSYRLPGFTYKNKPLIWCAAFRDHFSIFPTSGPIKALKNKLSDYKLAKGTIQFTLDKPIPDDLLTQIIEHRRDEIDSRN